MEFRQLSYFLEISRHRSFTHAAESLGLSQPALSRQIARLEREAGRALFTRSGRGAILTSTGEKLLPRALKLNDYLRETLDVLREEEDIGAGEYAIAAGGTVASFILPQALSALRKDYPEIVWRVLEGDAGSTRTAVLHGEADIGILTGPIRETALYRRFFLQDTIVPVARVDHPLFRKKKLRLQSLSAEDFVFFQPASAIRRMVEKRMRDINPQFKPHISMELRSLQAVVNSLEAGLGIGFISDFALNDKLRIIPIADLHIERKFYFCFRKERSGLSRIIDSIAARTLQTRIS